MGTMQSGLRAWAWVLCTVLCAEGLGCSGRERAAEDATTEARGDADQGDRLVVPDVDGTSHESEVELRQDGDTVTDRVPACVPSCVDPMTGGLYQCGPDGCGADCGSCPPGSYCEVNWCECLSDCHGRECGPDGCGGLCGVCLEQQHCVLDQGLCIPPCLMEQVVFPGEVVQVVQWWVLGEGGHPGQGLDMDGDPTTCAPVENCSEGIDNEMSGFFPRVLEAWGGSGGESTSEPYSESVAHDDLARLVQAEGWNHEGHPFTLNFYLGMRQNPSCDRRSSECNYYVTMDSMDQATCGPTMSFDNATLVGNSLTAGGAGYSFLFALVYQFDCLEPRKWTIPATNVSLVATVHDEDPTHIRTQGILGATINMQALLDAVKEMPLNPHLVFVSSPHEMIRKALSEFLHPDIDTTGDGEPDAVSIGIPFTTTSAQILGLEGYTECVNNQCVCATDCTDKECGDDGCGGSCGVCPTDWYCAQHNCVTSCEPSCIEEQCGDDGCGGSCGTCVAGQYCDTAGRCNANGTWTDPTSSLTWQVLPTGGTTSWDSAKSHCQTLELDGGGWRLPTIAELRSTVRGCTLSETGGTCTITDDGCLSWSCREKCYGCACYQGPGHGGCYWPKELQGACSWYWSASKALGSSPAAWCIDFRFSVVNGAKISNGSSAVRCVRDGPQ